MKMGHGKRKQRKVNSKDCRVVDVTTIFEKKTYFSKQIIKT